MEQTTKYNNLLEQAQAERWSLTKIKAVYRALKRMDKEHKNDNTG